MLSFGYLAEGDLYARHAVAIRIVLGIFSELRIDSVFLDRNSKLTHLFGKITQILVDILDNGIRILSRKKEVKKFPTRC